jgi:hypothetical protein
MTTTTHEGRAVPGQRTPAEPVARVNGDAIASAATGRESEIAGAKTADQIVRAQFDRGLNADQVEARQESIVAALLNESISHADKAFARGYASVVDTYTADFRELEIEAE